MACMRHFCASASATSSMRVSRVVNEPHSTLPRRVHSEFRVEIKSLQLLLSDEPLYLRVFQCLQNPDQSRGPECQQKPDFRRDGTQSRRGRRRRRRHCRRFDVAGRRRRERHLDGAKDEMQEEEAADGKSPDQVGERIAPPTRMVAMDEIRRRDDQIDHQEEADAVLGHDNLWRHALNIAEEGENGGGGGGARRERAEIGTEIEEEGGRRAGRDGVGRRKEGRRGGGREQPEEEERRDRRVGGRQEMKEIRRGRGRKANRKEEREINGEDLKEY